MNRAERRKAKGGMLPAGLMHTRFELPLPKMLELSAEDFAGVIATHVAESLVALEAQGADVRELTVITVGRRKLGTDDTFGIEVKSVADERAR